MKHEPVVQLLAQAFREDPFFKLMFKDEEWDTKATAMIAFLIKRNELLDGVLLTDDEAVPSFAAIVEKPAPLRRISVMNRLRLLVEMMKLGVRLPGRILPIAQQYERIQKQHLPTEPHYYITMIGVAASLRGKGVGKRVLQAVDELAASGPYPIALDTENEQNVEIYRRLGFTLTGSGKLGDVTMYCMTKPPEKMRNERNGIRRGNK
ncbi:GNAT family N-acetyltransferase [Alkalicoccus luteus]|uniref:GNAT family N-acetyltransferase n=1 Tax=Alkalicoccus luteus TaxID=1237094 RepID=UPI004034AF66